MKPERRTVERTNQPDSDKKKETDRRREKAKSLREKNRMKTLK